jgi:integrase
LNRRGHASADLSDTVIGPRIYEHEGIPSALAAEEVQKVLDVTRLDLSSTGLRDYAILMLLATYGLRAAEIVRLSLDDIDWRRDVLCVRHAKTGTYSELPLLTEPGEALLRYLERARPGSTHREIFLRILPPHRPFKYGSILNCITRARLRAAGVHPKGRKGPHAFRRARAVNLLRSGVTLKVIGDVLGAHVGPGDCRVPETGHGRLASRRHGAAKRGVAMTHVSPLDAKPVERFMQTQSLRHPVTPKNYAGTLCNFNNFVAKHGTLPTLSRSYSCG